MHHEPEQSAQSHGTGTADRPHPGGPRVEILDATGAIRLAEALAGSVVHGDAAHAGDADGPLAACREDAEKGRRASAVVRAAALSSSRDALRRIAEARLGVVAHAIAGHGDEELAPLLDVGWGVLCAAGPEDSFDLTLIARRAAEDSGVPFVVVHALGHGDPGAGRAVAMVTVPEDEACRAFVGPSSRLRPSHDPAHPSLAPLGDRAFAERVPFALGSALREYGNVSGRRHDLFDKVPVGEPPLMLVGMGPIGDALLCASGELRARGYDVGAVSLASLRPFPGARLVKALSRALAVTVLEASDEPLTPQGGLLAREVKSAFTDALTWVPGFPGIGRVPKLFVGVTGPAFDVDDLAAVCENMLAGERGKRSFSLPDAEHALPSAAAPAVAVTTSTSVRWILDDLGAADAALVATAAALAETLGLRVNGVITPRGDGATVDVLASREHARGIMARRGPRLVLATDQGVASPEAMAPLGPGAVLGVLSTSSSEGTVTDAARSLARERRARIVPIPVAAAGLELAVATAASCAGATVAAAARLQRTPLEATSVARAIGAHFARVHAAHADLAAERARRSFEATLEAVHAAEGGARN